MSKMLENQKPNFPPGTQTFYHAFTFGFLCDQLLRRVDPKKRSLGQFFREEIAVPYGKTLGYCIRAGLVRQRLFIFRYRLPHRIAQRSVLPSDQNDESHHFGLDNPLG